MTKEELLEEIDRNRKWLCDAGYTAYNIDVAFASIYRKVKELEQNPCEDCVSRQSVVDFLENHAKDFDDIKVRMAFRAASSLVENADNVPPVIPTSKWIPCSERLPKEGGDYLVSTSFDIGTDDSVREVYKDFFCILSQKWLNHDNDVIAWQPLPPSYQGE